MKITGYNKHGRLTERHATGKLIDIREKVTRHDAKAPEGTPLVKGDSDGAGIVLICIVAALLLATLAAGGLI